MRLVIDFETRSRCDLGKAGAYRYAEDPSTEIMCMALKVDDNPGQIWIPEKFRINTQGLPLITEDTVMQYIEKADAIVAHNTFFEICIYLKKLYTMYWPAIQLDKWHCTMAKALYHSLPAKLDTVAKVLNLPVQKDEKGHRVMLQTCKPRKPSKNNPSEWFDDPERLRILFDYCLADVDAEYHLDKALPELPDYERNIWLHDMVINLRGIPIDRVLVENIIEQLEIEKSNLLKEFTALTDYKVETPKQNVELIKVLKELNVNIPKKQNSKGDIIETLDKDAVEKILALPTIPDKARRLIEIKQSLGKSSTAKFAKMLDCICADGTVKGCHQYCGAHTARWGGRLIQPQNLPRPTLKEEEITEALSHFSNKTANLVYPELNNIASSCIRASIAAPEGDVFVCGDFSSIEGRGLAWFSDDQRALNVYREGKDPYIVNAQALYNVEYDKVTKDQRAVGKTQELACGYMGGEGAFRVFAEMFNLDLSNIDTKKAVKAWRNNRQPTVNMWYATEKQFFKAITNPGEVFDVGIKNVRVVYQSPFCVCYLPSGRGMYYYGAEIQKKVAPWGDIIDNFSYMGIDPMTNQWTRLFCHAGTLVENIVQALCRDFLAEAILRVQTESETLTTAFHVHDEIVALAKDTPDTRELLKKILTDIMSIPPYWALDFPMEADVWVGKRYKK